MEFTAFVALSLMMFMPYQLADGYLCLFPSYLTGYFDPPERPGNATIFHVNLDKNLLRLDDRLDSAGSVLTQLHNLTSGKTLTVRFSPARGKSQCVISDMTTKVRKLSLTKGLEDNVYQSGTTPTRIYYLLKNSDGTLIKSYGVLKNFKKTAIGDICTPKVIALMPVKDLIYASYWNITAPADPGLDIFTRGISNCIDSALG